MMAPYPRLLLAAPGSGSGKTVVTCGLLAALSARGMVCGSFKCGPDYIDPMFHKTVLGVDGANLDTWFMGRQGALDVFARFAKGKDISVVEGVMGYYDGVGGDTATASSYDAACALDAPVVLVVDGKGASLSLAALIKGFLEYKKDSHIRGVIFNRMSPVMAVRLTPAVEELGLKVYGCLPVCVEAKLDSRHLGLWLPGEQAGWQECLVALGAQMEKTVDVEGLIRLAHEAPYIEPGPGQVSCLMGKWDSKVRIAIAEDEAFCFYYQENRALLKSLGAELVPFSPMRDESLPEGVSGFILGGGYPELHAASLAENEAMRSAVKQAVMAGMPYLAECGGFLYLQQELVTEDGNAYPMTGVFGGRAFPVGRLSRFGYIELHPLKDTSFLKTGETIRAHEFHYWDTTENGTDMAAVKPRGDRSWECMNASGNGLAGFPHLYYLSNPQVAERFIAAAMEWENLKLQRPASDF